MLSLVTTTDSVSIVGGDRLPVERGDGLLDALQTDVVRLLGDEGLHVAGLELLDLVGARVEADDLGGRRRRPASRRSRRPAR